MIAAAQWKLVAPLLTAKSTDVGRGRPIRHSPRRIFNAVVWILRTGAPWHDLPKSYVPYQTAHKRFSYWVFSGTLRKVLQLLARDLETRGGINLNECFIDGSFASAKKGDSLLEKPNGEKVRNSWQLQTAMVFLSPYTQRLLHPTKSSSWKKLSNGW